MRRLLPVLGVFALLPAACGDDPLITFTNGAEAPFYNVARVENRSASLDVLLDLQRISVASTNLVGAYWIAAREYVDIYLPMEESSPTYRFGRAARIAVTARTDYLLGSRTVTVLTQTNEIAWDADPANQTNRRFVFTERRAGFSVDVPGALAVIEPWEPDDVSTITGNVVLDGTGGCQIYGEFLQEDPAPTNYYAGIITLGTQETETVSIDLGWGGAATVYYDIVWDAESGYTGTVRTNIFVEKPVFFLRGYAYSVTIGPDGHPVSLPVIRLQE